MRVIVCFMMLADRLAQIRSPLLVESAVGLGQTELSGAHSYQRKVLNCSARYVLTDDLVRLCAALAYSKGAKTLVCADLLRVPATSVWIEWSIAPWIHELNRLGFKNNPTVTRECGRRGALIEARPDGRSGMLRTFWTTDNCETDVLASSMQAYFDFDVLEGETPEIPDDDGATFRVFEGNAGDAEILGRCFRFGYERSWADYYSSAGLSLGETEAVARHALGTIAVEIPMLLAFFLMLSIRPAIPRKPLTLERLNRSRLRSGKLPLLDHIEVSAPVLPEYQASKEGGFSHHRRRSRLHHVRGHLVRRGSQIFWRVPHLRGSARAGVTRRTVTWTVDS